MKLIQSIVIAGMALALAGLAFAGRDQAQIMEQERAAQKLRAAQAPAGPQEKTRSTQGLAGPTGPQGQVGPAMQRSRVCINFGHPSERIRC